MMMTMRISRARLHGLALAGLGALALAGSGVQAAGIQPARGSGQDLEPSAAAPAITRRQTPIDRSGDARSEMRACRSGATQQDLATCLEEARNAAAARRSGNLDTGGEDYMANALARCEPLAGEDRAACEARVLGFGKTSGSVAGGGLLRWVETVVLPRGQREVSFAPKTAEPVVVVPIGRQ
jgi:hypothetical protein